MNLHNLETFYYKKKIIISRCPAVRLVAYLVVVSGPGPITLRPSVGPAAESAAVHAGGLLEHTAGETGDAVSSQL